MSWTLRNLTIALAALISLGLPRYGAAGSATIVFSGDTRGYITPCPS